MIETIKAFLIANAAILACLVCAVAGLCALNKTPLKYKLRAMKYFLQAKWYFYKYFGAKYKQYFDLWLVIVEEAMKSEMDTEDLQKFIEAFIKQYLFRAASNMHPLDECAFVQPNILRFSAEYVKNKQKISSK